LHDRAPALAAMIMKHLTGELLCGGDQPHTFST